MATIIDHDGKQYLLTFGLPETDWIAFIAKSLGMTKETVVGAALNQGLTHYVGMLKEIAEHEIDKGHAEAKTDEQTGDEH